LDPLLSGIEKEEGQKEEYYKGLHFMAIKKMKNGEFDKAEKLLGALISKISTFYKHNMEGKPLYHDIYRSLASCQFKLKRPKDALNSLNTTLSLQLVCEGKTHNVAMT
jgi:predicted Zn-dependent protease